MYFPSIQVSIRRKASLPLFQSPASFPNLLCASHFFTRFIPHFLLSSASASFFQTIGCYLSITITSHVYIRFSLASSFRLIIFVLGPFHSLAVSCSIPSLLLRNLFLLLPLLNTFRPSLPQLVSFLTNVQLEQIFTLRIDLNQ